MEAADKIGSHIPRLCYHPFSIHRRRVQNLYSRCGRLRAIFFPLAQTALTEGMKIKTNSPDIRLARRDLVELMLDNHPRTCVTCERDGNCELQNLAYKMGVRDRLYEGERKIHPLEKLKRIGYTRCREMYSLPPLRKGLLRKYRGVHNLSQMYRGFNTVVAPAFNAPMDDSVCIKVRTVYQCVSNSCVL